MNSKQQYILARDTIDMIREYVDNADVLEYINSFCFSIARILERVSVVDWDLIASICDQRYYSLKNTPDNAMPLDVRKLDELYSRYHVLIGDDTTE